MKLVRAELPTEQVRTLVYLTLEEFLDSGEKTMKVIPERQDGQYNWVRKFSATAVGNKMPVRVKRVNDDIYLIRSDAV